jgi:hypothetical protein
MFMFGSVEQLRQRLAKAIEKTTAEDPHALRRRIAELERMQKPQIIVERVEVPVLKPEQIEQLQELVVSLRTMADDLGAALATVRNTRPIPPHGAASPRQRVMKPTPLKASDAKDELHLKHGARRLLYTLAQRYPTKLTRSQLGTLAGLTPSGGTFGTYFATLKRQGLLTEAANGDVEITPAGLKYLGSDIPPKPQTTAEVLAMWQQALKAGAWRMLDTLVEVYPQSLSRETLGERTSFAVTGGTFGTYLGILRRNGLVEVTGDQVRAQTASKFPLRWWIINSTLSRWDQLDEPSGSYSGRMRLSM